MMKLLGLLMIVVMGAACEPERKDTRTKERSNQGEPEKKEPNLTPAPSVPSPQLQEAIVEQQKDTEQKPDAKRADCYLKEGAFEIYVAESSDASSLDLFMYSEELATVHMSRLQLVGNRVYSGIDGANWFNLTIKDTSDVLLDVGLLAEGYQEFLLKNCDL